MEHWYTATNVSGWVQSIGREGKIVHSGKHSAALRGHTRVLTRGIGMDRGKQYKISAWMYKGAGVRRGSIGLRSGDWKSGTPPCRIR